MYILYKEINISTELILKDLLIRPRTCKALTAGFDNAKMASSHLYTTHQDSFLHSLFFSKSIDTFKVQSLMVYDTGIKLPNCIS